MRTFISNAELEELGEGIIRNYAKGDPRRMECIDIEDLITGYIRLPLRYERFAEEDRNKIGFLSDGETPLKIYSNGSVRTTVFPLNTIVLESYLLRPQENGRRRFTMAHEFAHYLLQRHVPMQMASFMQGYDGEKQYTLQELREMQSISEVQADRLAAVLLMPKSTVEETLVKYNNGYKIRVYGRAVLSPSEKMTMRELSTQLGVSYTALFYRLRELKMLDYHDLEEYITANLFAGVPL